MAKRSTKPEITLLAPAYNEEESIDFFIEKCIPILRQTVKQFEILFVDDGSSDSTWEIIRMYSRKIKEVRGIKLSRNFGKEAAMSAGIDHCTGRWVIPIDVDLQDPPELIPELYRKATEEGFDVVYAYRTVRHGESFLKRFTANTFYRLIRRTNRFRIPQDTGDFRIMNDRVVQALRSLPEKTRFMKGLFAWVGFHQTGIPYEREPRIAGTTKWNYWKLWNFAIEGFTSFTTVPLTIWTYVGVSLSFLSFIYASFLFIRTMIQGVDLPGYASMMVTVLFLGGIQLITLGVIGEYLARVFEESKRRPLYLIQEETGRKQ